MATPGFSIHTDIVNKEKEYLLGDDWKWVSNGTPDRLLNALSIKGYAFTPGRWADGYDKRINEKTGQPKGERKAWKHALLSSMSEAWYIALDFDGGMSLQDGIDHPIFNSKACFLYTSPSHNKPGKGERFRVVFALSKAVTNKQELNHVIKGLRKEIGGGDDTAINAASALYGSKQAAVSHEYNYLRNRLDPAPYIESGEAARIARMITREDFHSTWDDMREEADEDLPALMTHCLRQHTDRKTGEVFRYIPERSSGDGTYDTCRDVVSGLVHTFGGKLTMKIVSDAEWWGDWDIDLEVEKYELREEYFDPTLNEEWCDYRTVLKKSRESLKGGPVIRGVQSITWECPAMPEADLNIFKQSTSDRVQHSQEALDEYAEIEAEDARKRLEQLARLSTLNVSHLLPKALTDSINKMSRQLSVAPEAIATSFLVGACWALGPRHNMRVLGSFYVPAILWIAVLQDAGTRKSAIKKAALKAIYHRDRGDTEKFNEALKEFNKLLAEYIENGKQGEKPREPMQPRDYIATGGTSEGLEKALGAPQNKGVLLRVLDELVGHFLSFDQHKGGKGNQRQKELLLWDGDYSKELRSTEGATRVLTDPRVPTLGFTQPEKLVGYIGKFGGLEHSDDGMWGRWLYVRPPYVPLTIDLDRMNEDDSRDFTELSRNIFDHLDDLPACTWEPTHEARLRIAEHMQQLDRRTRDEGSTFMKNVLSKMMSQVARLGLVVSAIKYAMDPFRREPGVIDLETIEACIKVGEYFIEQAAALKVEMPGERDDRKNTESDGYAELVIKYLNGRSEGDIIEAKMIQSGIRRFRDEKKPSSFIQEKLRKVAEALPTKYSMDSKGKKLTILS